MGKMLVKYDVRGIQAFVFRTNKLKEIRAVSDLPERIIAESFDEVIDKLEKEKKYYEIKWLDTAGGNALAVFENEDAFEEVSTRMAVKVMEKTYSLKLVYAAIELDDSKPFYMQYDELNKKLGELKASMPEAAHTGAFPICRQDYLTGFPIAKVEQHNDNRGKTFLTRESEIKQLIAAQNAKNSDDSKIYDDINKEDTIDDLIFEKGVDSHVAVIHIDGNNMGNRISEIIKNNGKYDNANGFDTIIETFNSITVSDAFKDVCKDIKDIILKYKEEKKAEKIRNKSYKGDNDEINKPLIYSVISAGDDITYITRAGIALPFTKLFLKKISEKNMYKNSEDHSKYGINACAGIAFIKSHFPFSDAYELAERCCSSAKKRAKDEKYINSNKDNPYGSWIDFEICTHIKNVDLEENRKKYGVTEDEDGNRAYLHMRPYCVSPEDNKMQQFFDFNKFEKKLRKLSKKYSEDAVNRSRSKELRQVYTEGGAAVSYFNDASKSRGYDLGELFEEADNSEKYASYYDETDMMDLVDFDFMDYVDQILEKTGVEK